jgi:glycosyltransferase involved in cell wall biosynthesis
VDTRALAAIPLPNPDPGRPLRIGYLGTAIPSKGLHVLVEAFQRLPQGTATLEIHGNSVPYHGEEGYLTRLLQTLGPREQVTYHGPYQTAELPRILGSVDLVVAPSLWHEAFGLTAREGLAAGRPVVVSRIGGLQDAVEDGVEGNVVPPGDVGALSAALGALAADREGLLRMAQVCRRRVRGFAAMTQELLEIYLSAREP